jgi:hypothetical protein
MVMEQLSNGAETQNTQDDGHVADRETRKRPDMHVYHAALQMQNRGPAANEIR